MHHPTASIWMAAVLGRLPVILLLVMFKWPASGRFTEFSKTVKELRKDLPGVKPPDLGQVPDKPETALAPQFSSKPAVPVQVIETSKANFFQLVQATIAADAARRVRESGAGEVVTTLAKAVLQLSQLAPSADKPMTSTSTA